LKSTLIFPGRAFFFQRDALAKPTCPFLRTEERFNQTKVTDDSFSQSRRSPSSCRHHKNNDRKRRRYKCLCCSFSPACLILSLLLGLLLATAFAAILIGTLTVTKTTTGACLRFFSPIRFHCFSFFLVPVSASTSKETHIHFVRSFYIPPIHSDKYTPHFVHVFVSE
jgi:hypothetical protein